MKHFSCAMSCSCCACAMSVPSATVTCGRSVTLVKRPRAIGAKLHRADRVIQYRLATIMPASRAQVQVRQHVAGRERRQQHLLGIPLGSVATESRIGRTGKRRLAFRCEIVAAVVVAIAGGAGAAIAGPAQACGVVVILADHASLLPKTRPLRHRRSGKLPTSGVSRSSARRLNAKTVPFSNSMVSDRPSFRFASVTFSPIVGAERVAISRLAKRNGDGIRVGDIRPDKQDQQRVSKAELQVVFDKLDRSQVLAGKCIEAHRLRHQFTRSPTRVRGLQRHSGRSADLIDLRACGQFSGAPQRGVCSKFWIPLLERQAANDLLVETEQVFVSAADCGVIRTNSLKRGAPPNSTFAPSAFRKRTKR